MAIRAENLTNFQGDKYLTESVVDAKIAAACESTSSSVSENLTSSISDSLIDSETGNLKAEYNPVQILSMENPSGLTGEDENKDFDYSKLKFIGNCKVSYSAGGQITIRIGDNLNCSVYNTTDGISNAIVSAVKSGDEAGFVSGDYSSVSTADGATSFQIFNFGDKITANAGSEVSTAEGATDGTNGNEVHFENNDKVQFIVYIKEGNNEEATKYILGPITGNGSYSPKNASDQTVSGIVCTITNFGTEPKTAKGATGYSGNVNFIITPSSIYSDSTAFKLEKIEMVQATSAAGVTPVVYTQDAVWTNTTVNGTYFCLKEITRPGTPASADYTVTPVIKQESGVTFITTSSTMKPSGTGFKNIGYPAYVSNKVYCAYNTGNEWFTAFNASESSEFTTWTTEKDATMDWEYSDTKALKSGKFDNPQVVLNGVNFNGSGSTATSAKTNNKLWVHAGDTSGSNISDTRYDASFSSKSSFASTDLSASGNTDLQVYQGLLQYPSTDYSEYNLVAFDSGSNPDYSDCSGDRYYYMKFSKAGSMPSGQLDVVAMGDISSAISSGSLQFQIAKDASMSKLYNVVFTYAGSNNIGGSNSSYGSTCALKYTFDDGAANDYIWLKITMKQGCGAQIKKVLLNGGSLA